MLPQILQALQPQIVQAIQFQLNNMTINSQNVQGAVGPTNNNAAHGARPRYQRQDAPAGPHGTPILTLNDNRQNVRPLMQAQNPPLQENIFLANHQMNNLNGGLPPLPPQQPIQQDKYLNAHQQYQVPPIAYIDQEGIRNRQARYTNRRIVIIHRVEWTVDDNHKLQQC